MSAVVPIVVVLLLIILGVAAYFGWKRYARWKSNKALLDWAGANIDYSQLESGSAARRSSVTSLLMSDVSFALFTSTSHGFRVSYPKDWSVDAARSYDTPIVVQFSCAQSDRVYKTFSVVCAPDVFLFMLYVHVPHLIVRACADLGGRQLGFGHSRGARQKGVRFIPAPLSITSHAKILMYLLFACACS